MVKCNVWGVHVAIGTAWEGFAAFLGHPNGVDQVSVSKVSSEACGRSESSVATRDGARGPGGGLGEIDFVSLWASGRVG